MTLDEFLKSDWTLEQYAEVLVQEALTKQEAERAVERRAADATAIAQREAFRTALLPTLNACGVRPRLMEEMVQRAATVFQLRDGTLVPRPGVVHPHDPCADYDPVTWLADVRKGPDGDIVFPPQR